jgi:hypothetical protein
VLTRGGKDDRLLEQRARPRGRGAEEDGERRGKKEKEKMARGEGAMSLLSAE